MEVSYISVVICVIFFILCYDSFSVTYNSTSKSLLFNLLFIYSLCFANHTSWPHSFSVPANLLYAFSALLSQIKFNRKKRKKERKRRLNIFSWKLCYDTASHGVNLLSIHLYLHTFIAKSQWSGSYFFLIQSYKVFLS